MAPDARLKLGAGTRFRPLFFLLDFTGSTGWRILIESRREIAAADFGLGFTPPRGVDETAAGEISSSAW
jgi:hypothetical protein